MHGLNTNKNINMNTKLLKAGAFFAPFLLLTGCVDESYQLDDIDTTTRLTVDNLVVPINIKPFQLGDFFEPDGNIEQITLNGKPVYAFVQKPEEGDEDAINTEAIEIPTVSMASPTLPSSQQTLVTQTQLPPLPNIPFRPKRLTDQEIQDLVNQYSLVFDIKSLGESNQMNYKTNDVDNAIKSISNASVYATDVYGARKPITLRINLGIIGMESVVEKMVFSGVELQCPKGLVNTTGDVVNVGTYNAQTGIWSIPDMEWNATGGTLVMNTDKFVFAQSPIKPGTNNKNIFEYNSNFYVKPVGTVKLVPKIVNGLPATIPTSIDIKADFVLDQQITIGAVSGKIEYKLDVDAITDIDLNDLPDFLDDDRTNLVLSQPMIYVGLNNPVASVKVKDSNEGLKPELSLKFIAERSNGVSDVSGTSAKIALPAYQNVANPDQARYNFVLADVNDKSELPADPEGFENAILVKFAGLSNLLANPDFQPSDENSKAGLPDKIKIQIEDPKIPETEVVNFELGKDIPGVKGNYEMIAPLGLGKNSLIVYSDVADWESDDLDDLHITKLTVGCDVLSELPVDAELSFVLLGKEKPDGTRDRITEGITYHDFTVRHGDNKGVQLGATIDKGFDISGIGGIEYIAILSVSQEQADALSPEHSLTLSNVKATIGGYYESDFKSKDND